ncbi:RNA polymerase sigma factor [Marinicella rhabdoformis]|uniref:RNA polymerase sigma factor n=1 Tax=Marinicella rhabdoformis TaxID=2580566 RepID=UPI0012AEC4D3|nr:RNA polymerase sigma factor [Marinicella rhabdoformis]
MKTEKVFIELLLLQAQQGDSSALDKLLPIVQQKMMHYARRIMNENVEAEDCVQDAVMVFLKQFVRIKNTKAFHGWLYKVINSRCCDYWRKYKHEQQAVTPIDELVVQPVESDLTSQPVLCEVFDVKVAMSRLSPVQRSVIYLFYFEGFKVVEIAAILDKPAGTIKSHLFDARKAIKIFLNQE